jgi:hypothetical protein
MPAHGRGLPTKWLPEKPIVIDDDCARRSRIDLSNMTRAFLFLPKASPLSKLGRSDRSGAARKQPAEGAHHSSPLWLIFNPWAKQGELATLRMVFSSMLLASVLSAVLVALAFPVGERAAAAEIECVAAIFLGSERVSDEVAKKIWPSGFRPVAGRCAIGYVHGVIAKGDFEKYPISTRIIIVFWPGFS